MRAASRRALCNAGPLLLLALVSAVRSQDMVVECTTPGGVYGSCVLLASCQSLVRQLSTGNPVYLDLVRKSHCGFTGAMPKVCCPNDSDTQSINFPKDADTATGSSKQTNGEPTTTAAPHRTTPFFPITNTQHTPRLPQPTHPTSESPLTLPPTWINAGQPGASSANFNQQPLGEVYGEQNKKNGTGTGGGAIKEVAAPGGDRTTTTPRGKERDSTFHQLPSGLPGSVPVSAFGEAEKAALPGDALPDIDTCGAVPVDYKIFGGENTTIEDFRWMVLLKYRVGSKDNYGCGGVLINNRYVLTAAHCVKTPNSYQLTQVRLGEWNLDTVEDCEEAGCNDPPLDVDIENVVVHPEFDKRNLTNDIAIIRLAEYVKYSEWIQPICLPDSVDQDFSQDTFWVAGWGRTENGHNSAVKLKLQVRHVDLDICSVAYRRLKIALGPGQLCAGGTLGRDSCAGDSGGALMKIINHERRVNFYAVGIVSLGPSRCGIEGYAGVYTKVSYYSNWIKSSLRP